MIDLIKAAVMIQLAEHVGFSREDCDKLDELARSDVNELNAYIDRQTNSKNDKERAAKFQKLRSSIRNLQRDLQFSGDCATLIANYESFTGRRFIQPAWLSSELEKVDNTPNNL